jgi:hypothetical protein
LIERPKRGVYDGAKVDNVAGYPGVARADAGAREVKAASLAYSSLRAPNGKVSLTPTEVVLDALLNERVESVRRLSALRLAAGGCD